MWFAVRHVIRSGRNFEERITLWRAASFDEAIALAEAEAVEYAADIGGHEALGLWQAYELPEPPGHGVEVFSLIRASNLEPKEYLDRYFDTGDEFQQRDEE
jgi:hypothetical protein